MDFSLIKTAWPVLKAMVATLKSFLPMLLNLICRPKLLVSLKMRTVMFKSQDGKEPCIEDYPCLLLANQKNSKVLIKPGSLKINNESYLAVIQSDENFLRLGQNSKNPWLGCDNEMYAFYKQNWRKISEGDLPVPADQGYELVFPLRLLKGKINLLLSDKKNSLLFLHRKKISITINVNGREFEYGLDKMESYKLYLNYLAFLQGMNQM